MSRATVDDDKRMSQRLSQETEAKVVCLTARDHARVLDLLENPPKPNAKLRAAIAALPDTICPSELSKRKQSYDHRSSLRCIEKRRENSHHATNAIRLGDATMPTVTIRNLSHAAHRALKARATQHGRSVAAETRHIVETAGLPETRLKLGSAIAEITRHHGVTDQDIDALDQIRAELAAEGGILAALRRSPLVGADLYLTRLQEIERKPSSLDVSCPPTETSPKSRER